MTQTINLTNKSLIQKWIDKLGLQGIPITVRHPSNEIKLFNLYAVHLSYNPNGFLIEYSNTLSLWSSLHKLGYIYIAHKKGKLDHFKKHFFTGSQQDIRLGSAFFDCVIENHFRKIDQEYQKVRGLQVFTHSSTYYEEWYKEASVSKDIVNICFIYVSDYLNFLYNMPEYYKGKLYKTIQYRFNKTRVLILEIAKKQGLKFTNDDFIKIHELLKRFEITLDYDVLNLYVIQLKDILKEIRSVIKFN